jgi:hypothetical protein
MGLPTLAEQLAAMNPGMKVIGQLATKPLPKNPPKAAPKENANTTVKPGLSGKKAAEKAKIAAKAPKVKAEKVAKVKAEKVAKVKAPVHPDGTVFFRADRQKWIAMGFQKYSGKQEAARPTKQACIDFLKKKYNFTAIVIE